MKARPTWDEYFMHLAEESALRSKDPHTQVGSCIVKDKRILSLGYNGAPRKFPDQDVPLTNDSQYIIEQKNSFMCHSELNSILNYRGNLSDFEGATIYVTCSPCHECVKALIQVGIKSIIYKEEYHNLEIVNLARYLAKACHIEYKQIED